MNKTIYIAGPMRSYVAFNFPAFDAARDELTAMGWNPISPADMDREVGFDPTKDEPTKEFLDAALDRDVDAIRNVDALCLLEGWQKSVGATAEAALAQWRQIPIYQFPDMKEIINVRFSSYTATGKCNTKPRLIAFTGAKQSGKTTLANMICREGGGDYVRMSFAQPMREMLGAMGIEKEYLYDKKTEPISYLPGQPTARHLMQTIGTEWGRDCVHNDLWIAVAMESVKKRQRYNALIAFDDLRFPNEAKAIKEAGGIIVRILRDGLDSSDEHESEKYWKEIPYDWQIVNNGEPKDMLEELNHFINTHIHDTVSDRA